MNFSSATLSEIDLADTDVLCIYGWSKELYESLLPWLEEKEERYAVFLHDREEFLDLTTIFHPHVRYYSIGSDIEEVCKQIAWEFVFLRCRWLENPEYKDAEKVQNLKNIWNQIYWGVHLVASDYQDLGAVLLKNVRCNLQKAENIADFSSLKGQFSKIPAVICGAGPSLTENVETLKSLTQNALIFGGGSSLTALSAHSVPFHLGASIDPDPSYARFFEHSAFETPFFYQDRLSSQILSLVHAKQVHVPSSGGYPLEQWLSESLGLEDITFDGGWTVATFCTALAQYLGCDPIIFVGMDFAYSAHVYAQGLRETETHTEKASDSELHSKKDWLMAVKWLEQFAQEHKDHLFLNASQGGLEMEGICKMPLEEAANKHMRTRSYDVRGLVHAALEALPKKKIDPDQKAIVFENEENSRQACEDLCDQMLHLFERFYPENPCSKGEFIICQYDLYDEIIYQKLLEPLWAIWKYVFERKQSLQAYGGALNELLFFKKILQAHKRWKT